MGRSYWSVYTLGSGDTWQLDSLIAIPNADLDMSTISTQIKMKRADGGLTFFTPSIKYNKEPITFNWLSDDDSSIWTLVQSYLENGTKIKIVTQNPSIYFIGKFISNKPKWLVKRDETFDVEAMFEIMEE